MRIFNLADLVSLLKNDNTGGYFAHLENWGKEGIVIAVTGNEINYHKFTDAGLIPWMSHYNERESQRITTRFKIPLQQIAEFRNTEAPNA